MTTQTKTTNVKIIFSLTLVHFIGDFYSSFSSPLFPAFVDKLSLTMTQVGIIAGVIRFLAFIVQPTVGYLADRYQTRYFALGGLFLTVFFIPLTGIAPSFWVLLILLSVGSIGSSMFHPSVTGMVPLYSGRNSGFNMSIFNTGGTLAFAVGPLFISWIVVSYGLEATPYTMIIGLGAIFFLYQTVPVPLSEGMKNSGFIGSLKESIGPVFKSILLIWLVMVIRAIVGQSFLTFLPIFFAKKGFSLVAIGLMISLFTIGGTISGLIAGYWSDRIGYKRIFYLTHGLMVPSLIIYLQLSDFWVFVGAFVAGFFVLASLPLGVVMAQKLAPKGRSMVSSLMMGLAYGLGGVFSPVIGKLSDMYTVETVLFYTALIPIPTLFLIYYFPDLENNA